MASPLRIEYPGAYFNVMNRGNRGEVERIYFYPTTIERFFWMDLQIAVNPTVLNSSPMC